MCGICGIIDYKGGYIREDIIRSMTDRMVHRGPDDGAVFLELEGVPQVGLGHRRLSIIDLSALGRQPMGNEDGMIRIVLNGEIYNYRSLKDGLKQRGHIFKSETDTEVVLHLYEERGAGCVEDLRGMFAFAIWDDRDKSLFIARDRVGKKPVLYYHDEAGRFCFASEFSSLLAGGLIEKEINYEALDSYLTFGCVPAPLTIYKKVFKLLPGHTLRLKDNEVDIRRYWQIDYEKKIDLCEEEAAEECLRLLKESVRIRLRSDVPLGAFLSGGVDSSAVAAIMSRESSGRIKTFSIGFDDKDYDELKYARVIAERFNTDHCEFVVKPDAMSILPLLVERYGEPYADSSSIPTYYVCNQTKRHVTVALSGDGSDESFAGYERYQAMVMAEACHRMPALARLAISGVLKSLPDSINPKSGMRRMKRFASAAGLPTCERYLRWAGIFSKGLKEEVYSEDFIDKTCGKNGVRWIEPYIKEPGRIGLLDRLLMTDVNTYLPNDLLVKTDIASMANSLEVRSPFLDHKLMEFAASLPPHYKMKRFVKKYILKKALGGLVPRQNITRRKMGFGLPVGSWFRAEMRDFLRDTILSKKSSRRGYFKAEKVREMTEAHISKRKDHTFQLWSLLMLELWHRRFID
ncbi:MAG: asparagine synthase (glutamine-hydrolyzing) [Candidatus Omnitrophota bacterium]|nr:asparagine synthase (glutamine-hydrolyzing) [Candidatus Omnitrophota bacterium]